MTSVLPGVLVRAGINEPKTLKIKKGGILWMIMKFLKRNAKK